MFLLKKWFRKKGDGFVQVMVGRSWVVQKLQPFYVLMKCLFTLLASLKNKFNSLYQLTPYWLFCRLVKGVSLSPSENIRLLPLIKKSMFKPISFKNSLFKQTLPIQSTVLWNSFCSFISFWGQRRDERKTDQIKISRKTRFFFPLFISILFRKCSTYSRSIF